MDENAYGFPEGQLVPWGMSLKTAVKVGRAFRKGSDMRAVIPKRELTPIIEGIIRQMEAHPQRGILSR